MTILLSGVLSAFLINDVVCVALTPLVLHLARRMKFDPIPHLIGLARDVRVPTPAQIQQARGDAPEAVHVDAA